MTPKVGEELRIHCCYEEDDYVVFHPVRDGINVRIVIGGDEYSGSFPWVDAEILAGAILVGTSLVVLGVGVEVEVDLIDRRGEVWVGPGGKHDSRGVIGISKDHFPALVDLFRSNRWWK